MERVCIIYSSVDGQTKKICETMRDMMKEDYRTVDIYSISESYIDINSYDKILIGASVRYGSHRKNISRFIRENKVILDIKKTAFFSVNLTARKKEKCKPESNPYLLKFFKKIDWRPKCVAVFAGVLDYQGYSFLDSLMIKLIMTITKGPKTTTEPIEYTDWQQVKDFGNQFKLM